MKSLYKITLLVSFFSLFAFQDTKASHAMGADLEYKCLGNNQYEVTLRFYRDCSGISAPTNATIQVVNVGCGGGTTLNVVLTKNINLACPNGGVSGTAGCEVSQVCPSVLPLTTCNIANGIYPGVTMHEYTGSFTLPSACSQWMIRFTESARNPNNNLSSSNQNLSIQSIINNTTDPLTGNPYCNISPSFFNTPIIFTCLNTPTSYFQGAIEPDGDSLVYKLVNPLGSSFAPITSYATGYAFDQPIKTNPAMGLSFNQQTGEMLFTPSQIETDVIAVIVEEYRNGVLVGSSLRDVQLAVINCVKSVPEFASSPVSMQGAIQLDSISYQICPNTNFELKVLGFDRNNQDVVLSSNLQSGINSPLLGASFSTQYVGIGAQDSAIATIQWTPTAANLGCRYFSIKATSNGCPVTADAIKTYRVCVDNKIVVNPDTAYYCGNPIQVYSNGGIGGVWTPAVGVSNVNAYSPLITPPITDMWYHYTSSCGHDSVLFRYKPALNVSVGQDGAICLGDSFQLHVFYDSILHPNAQVKWTPATALFDPTSGMPSANINHPVAKPQFSTNYTVEVSTGYGCTAQAMVNLAVRSTKNVAQITSTRDSICPGMPIELTASNYSSFLCGLASEACGGYTKRGEIGNSATIQGGGASLYPSIYGSNKKYVRHQLLIKAAEIQAKLGNAGCQIFSLESFIGTLNSNADLNNFTIKMNCTKLDSLVKFENSLVQVFDPKNVTPILGRNLHLFDHPYNWDGQSDLVVDFCFENIIAGSTNNKDIYTATPYRSYIFEASNVSSSCNAVNTQTPTATVFYTYRPNLAFNTCLANAPTSTFAWTPISGANAPTSIVAEKAFAQPLTTQTYSVSSIDSFGCISSATKDIYVDIFSNGSCIGRNIFGNVHEYIAANCGADTSNPGQVLKNVKVNLKDNGVVVAQTFSSNSGDFSFQGNLSLNYTIEIDTSNLPFAVFCPWSNQRSITLTNAQPKVFKEDFALSCSVNPDMQVHFINGRYRIGSPSITTIKLGDISSTFYNSTCSSSSSGTVTTILSGPVNYIGPAPGALAPTAINGNTLSYTIANFSTLGAGAFDLELQGNLSSPLGTPVCVKTIVSALLDANSINDTLAQCSPTVNSFDPNEKEVYPKTLSSDGGWLTYTIHFQNTGNDTAYNVVIRDTLPQLVDAESLVYLASSHSPEIQIINGQVIFTFENINLVDSLTNEAGSKGWVQFKIKSKTNLPAVFAIPNRVAIFFDQNPPILTDYAVTRNEPLSVSSLRYNTNFQLFPNPFKESITIQSSDNDEVKMRLEDLMGREITNASFKIVATISLENLPRGVYIVYLQNAQTQRAVYKVVKE